MTPLNLDQLLRVAEEAESAAKEVGHCGEGMAESKARWDYQASTYARFSSTFDPPTVKALIEQNRALVEALRELWLRTASGSDEQRVAALSAAGDLLATLGALLSQEEDA